MRKALVFLIGLLTLAVAVAACSGSKSSGNGTPTPTASPSPSPAPATWMIIGTNATAHNGQIAMARFKNGASVSCSTSMSPVTAGAFTITSGGIMTSTTYSTVELVLNLDGNDKYNSGTDHAYSHSPVTVTSNVTLHFDHNNPGAGGWTGPTAITWTSGMSCPGN